MKVLRTSIQMPGDGIGETSRLKDLIKSGDIPFFESCCMRQYDHTEIKAVLHDLSKGSCLVSNISLRLRCLRPY